MRDDSGYGKDMVGSSGRYAGVAFGASIRVKILIVVCQLEVSVCIITNYVEILRVKSYHRQIIQNKHSVALTGDILRR
jgi:hypothetical protein